MTDARAPWSSRLLSLYPTSRPPRPALDTVGDRDVLLDRVLAALFDVAVCLFVVESPSLFVLDALSGGRLAAAPWFLPLALLVLAPLVVTYSFAFEWQRARTPGKVWRGLVVVTDDGVPCSLAGSAVRNLFRYVDYLGVPPLVVGMASAILSPRGKRLGDRVAGTVVVRTR